MNGGRLQGRVALVTGASRNIGRAVALAFATEGADLVLNTRVNAGELDAVAAECHKAGVRTVTALGDVGDPAVCQAVVERGLAELGAVDVLVCNAAIRPHKSVTDTSVEEWHRVLGVNLHSAFYLARSAVPAMKERRRGSIIALGGMSSLTGRPNTAAVTVAKTGLLGLVRRVHRHRAPPRRVVSGVPPVAAGLTGRAREDPAPAPGPAGGHRGRLRLSRVRRVVLCHRRLDPRDGRSGDRLTGRDRQGRRHRAEVWFAALGRPSCFR